MNKKELRQQYRQMRRELPETERLKADDLMLIQFQTLELPFLHALFTYWPIEENHEPNTHLFTEFLKFRNAELIVAYPVIDRDSLTMNAIATDIDTPFEKTSFNLFEPQKGEPVLPGTFDMVIVPLLCFDKKGFRVGYGRGYYDRYLAACKPGCLKVGFSYFGPVDEIGDTHEFDVPLDLCITPKAVYGF
jgi:5-formyltetrahydrofolate cyclo-ligase